MVQFQHLNEPTLLYNLAQRYDEDQIYTRIGPILLSVNPYKPLPMYGLDSMAQYRSGEQTPHVFEEAEDAFIDVRDNHTSQSVLITGESGSGKTEVAKYLLSYICWRSGHGDTKGSLEAKILSSNPLLEAMGNAKTVRNHNSSRFGKFLNLEFLPGGHIGQAVILQYLLEKTRVTSIAVGERNFHIFYQILSGLTNEERQAVDLQAPAESWKILANGVTTAEGVNDTQDWQQTKASLENLGLGPRVSEMVRLLSAILHLGNIEFLLEEEGPQDSIVVGNPEVTDDLARLLGCRAAALENLFCRRRMESGRGSVFFIPLSQKEATASRDALMKQIYHNLFVWTVDAINQSLSGRSGTAFIGIVDIFGFEQFPNNSLEQLLINLANEMIQQLFIETVFKLEQEDYLSEGVTWVPVNFDDNEDCLSLIGRFIIPMLNEECRLPKGSDDNLLQKMNQFSSKSYLPELKEGCFAIKHFAGKTTYNINGFVEKNRDTVFPDLVKFMSACSQPLVKELFPPTQADRVGTLKQNSTAIKFTDQLMRLTSTIKSTRLHFIRCFKPNPRQASNAFDAPVVLAQMQNVGILQTVTLRRSGFPYRFPLTEFCARHSVTPLQLSTLLSLHPASDWALGKSKVFLKAALFRSLEASRLLAVRRVSAAVFVQSLIRRWLARRLLARLKEEQRAQLEEFHRKIREEQEAARLAAERTAAEERRRAEEEERARREEEAFLAQQKREKEAEEARLEQLRREEQKKNEEERQKEQKKETKVSPPLPARKLPAPAKTASQSNLAAPPSHPADIPYIPAFGGRGSVLDAREFQLDGATWQEFVDDRDGKFRPYFFNKSTQETVWEDPRPLQIATPPSSAPAPAPASTLASAQAPAPDHGQASSDTPPAGTATPVSPVEPKPVLLATQSSPNLPTSQAAPAPGARRATDGTPGPLLPPAAGPNLGNSPMQYAVIPALPPKQLGSKAPEPRPTPPASPTPGSSPSDQPSGDLYEVERPRTGSILDRSAALPNTPEAEKSKWFRNQVVEEVFTTERDYFMDLRLIVDIFIVPMRTILNAQEHAQIFSNIEILKGFHLVMLKELKKIVRSVPKPDDGGRIGPVFVQLAEYFKMYSIYCTNQPGRGTLAH